MTLSLQSKTIDAGFAHHQAGNLEAAEALYRQALAEDGENINGLHLLGLAMHQRGQSAQAVVFLEKAATVLERDNQATGDHAALYNNLGNTLRAAGRAKDAAARYGQGLALDPNFCELHVNLGNSLLENGDLTGAVASYRTALALSPEQTGALTTLAYILIEHGQSADALPLCRQLERLAPQDANTQFLLGRALGATGDNRGAVLALTACVKRDPQHAAAHYWLGVILARVGKLSIALPFLERAVALRPDDAGAYAELGNVLQDLGEVEKAFDCFRVMIRLRPLTTWPATRSPADFSVLLIASPGVANTPPDFLFANAAYESHFVALLPGIPPDVDLLGRHGDIVVNLISDADQAHAMLTEAATLVDRLGRLVINHPRLILNTGREAVASLLVGIEDCHVPPTIRMTRAALTAPDAAAELRRRGCQFPLLLRLAGSHGGETFEKVETVEGMARFVEAHPDDLIYVTPYVDYLSADGYFRKYRFVLTDQDILPYHLAISENWKVHHYTTAMDRHAWMQDEEKAFLSNPEAVFSPAHFAAMAVIRDRIGLEFFGIDCSLDHEGKLLLFEANASILIHDDNADFPYKTPFCYQIKEAIGAMLARAAPHPPLR